MTSLVELQAVREALLARHPWLEEVAVLGLDEAGIDNGELARFLTANWRDTGAELTLQFREDILDALLTPGMGRAAFAGGELIGTVLSFPFEAKLCVPGGRGEGKVTYAVNTGLATSPAYRGRGVGQLLHYTNQMALNQAGHAFSVFWFADKRQDRRSSVHLFSRQNNAVQGLRRVRLVGRKLTTDRVERGVGGIVQALAGAMHAVSPSRVREIRGCSQMWNTAVDTEALLEGAAWSRAVGFGPGRLQAYARNERQFLFSLEAANRACKGLVLGTVYDGHDSERFALLDSVDFHETLEFGSRVRMLRACEHRLREEHGCMGCAATDLSLPAYVMYGFLPFASQHLAFDVFQEMKVPVRELAAVRPMLK